MSGIETVEIALRDSASNYWDGTSLAPGYKRVAVPVVSGTWSYTIDPPLPEGFYYTTAFGFIGGAGQAPYPTASLNTDVSAPTSDITTATADEISGTAGDNIALRRVQIAIRTLENRPRYWDGSQLVYGYRAHAADLMGGTWEYDPLGMPPGDYVVTSQAVDINELAEPRPFTQALFTVNASGACGAGVGDGEGCASYSGPYPLTTGELQNWTISLVVGPSGIAPGGGVAIGFHHASSWWVQVNDPTKRHYVEGPAGLDMSWSQHVPTGMFDLTDTSYTPDRMFHRLVTAETATAIPPGTVLDFHFGASPQQIRTQNFVDEDHEFRVATDIDGDGKFDGLIVGSPRVKIAHSTPTEISAVVDSDVLTGQPTDVHIRVEDIFFNLAKGYSGSATVADENGTVLATDVAISNGIGAATVQINTAGAHRLRITSADGLVGRSNPLRVAADYPVQRVFWGDLHGHTGESDGLGLDATEYFDFGCNTAKLDFIALTDHGIPNWEANVAAVKAFHQPNECVTILATEANSRNNPRDHNNLYFRDDDAPPMRGWPLDYSEYLERVHDEYNHTHNDAFTGPHHTGYDRGAGGDPLYPFGAWDDRSARFFEVYSSHGASEYLDNPRPLAYQSTDPTKYMQGGLDLGHKFAVIAASDNHDTKPGRSAWGAQPGGLAAVRAPSLNRDEVFDAMWSYQTYATGADRIYLAFDVDGEPMGSTIPSTAGVVDVYVITKTDSATIELVGPSGAVVDSWSTTTGLLDTTTTVGQHDYLYVRVTQSNGEQAWSTPVWME